jgi:hypothetical protein
MKSACILVLLSGCIISKIDTSLYFRKYRYRVQSVGLSTANVLLKVEKSSLVGCSVICGNTEDCVAFNLDTQSNCFLYAIAAYGPQWLVEGSDIYGHKSGYNVNSLLS